MSQRARFHAALFLVWAVPVGAALYARPLLPVDETRYLSVAWEMWNRGDWLVPHLNGRPYSDKPPLLFWLFLLGWSLGGVGELWPRLVSPLLSLASVLLLRRLGRDLWPEAPAIADQAAVLLLGSLLWMVYQTVVLFDLLLGTAVLAGWLGLLRAARGRAVRGFSVFAVALGAGILAKGPVALLWLLPAALLAPWWQPRRGAGRGHLQAGLQVRPSGIAARGHYLGLLAAVLAGCGIALLWALPAARAGGEAYAESILWHQTAGRVVHSFAHRRPVWWYLPVLPAAWLPWSLWPALLRALAGLRGSTGDPGLRFGLAASIPALLVLSVVSGKQAHYLLPLVPLAALICTFALFRAGPAMWGKKAWTLALSSALVTAGLHLALARRIAAGYDAAPFALCLKSLEERGMPLAYAGRYQGEFHFLGRLGRPLAEIGPEAIGDWLEREPRGAAVVRRRVGSAAPAEAAAECTFILAGEEVFSLVSAASPAEARPPAR